ncbi:hypothetical protein Q31a_20570 [Aureliella helgolandensis]|uniref:Uncharacterized protein n=1 Tax=Aureliella helgolandensis TaxID=2527968 RepID=A0A518G585_9BACT|nr:hypothetical protein Q31a_20570 [Aureliella helgolandensis]
MTGLKKARYGTGRSTTRAELHKLNSDLAANFIAIS